MMMPLSQLVPGDELSSIAVNQYAAILKAGVELPPIVVKARNDGVFQILDGNHRTEAARRLGRSEIAVKVIQ
jgi:ParB-like chromosome segregation protein Spo0J